VILEARVQKTIRAEFQIDRPDLSDAELKKAWDIARRTILRHVRGAPWWIDRESLEAAGRAGFWLSVTRYDRAQVAQLSSYTTRAVMNSLQEEERVQSPWTRPQQELIRAYRREDRELEPWMKDPLWFDAPIFTGEDGRNPESIVGDYRPAPANIDRDGMTEGMTQEPLRVLAARMLRSVPERQREVLIRYFYHGQIYTLVAKTMGISESRVHQLRNEAYTAIRTQFPGVEALL
jgi:RNA polymerase sigma factor (sigma-70 family)